MTGIFGIIKEDKIRDNELDFLMDPITRKSWQICDVFRNGNIALGKEDLVTIHTPITIDKGIVAGFYGHAVAYKEVQNNSQIEVDIEVSPSKVQEKLIEAYNFKKLDDFIPTINGLFSFFVFDKNYKRLIIGTDRYGLKHVFYRRIIDGFAFSSVHDSLIRIDGTKNTLNLEAIAEFFYFFWLIGNKTLIREISILPPASILTYENGEFKINKYWSPHYEKDTRDLTEEDTLNEIDKRLKRAVSRRVSKSKRKINLTLSGGLDSRAILANAALVKKEAQEIITYNYGISKNNTESIFAELLSKKYKCRHIFVPYFAKEYQTNLKECVGFVGEGISGSSFKECGTYRSINNKKFNYVLTGAFGEHLSGAHITTNFLGANKEALADELFKSWNIVLPYNLRHTFFKRSIDPYIDTTRNLLKHLIEDDTHSFTVNTSCFIDFTERQRRFVAIIGLIGSNFIEVYSPFTDYDYVDFMLTLPVDFRVGQRLFKKYLRERQRLATTIPRNTLELLGNEDFNILIWSMITKIKNMASAVLNTRFIKPMRAKGIDLRIILAENRDFIIETLFDERRLWTLFIEEKFVLKIMEKDLREIEGWESYLLDRLVSLEIWFQILRNYIEVPKEIEPTEEQKRSKR